MVDVSVVFRALNEEKWFDDALTACRSQKLDNLDYEIVLVDSGSTDRTIEIAESHDCRIVHIPKSQFTFGRSLNWGCEAANGKYLVFISAHCVPTHDRWLQDLIQPLIDGTAQYTYGRQLGHEVSKFSEHRLFAKYFPEFDAVPQRGFFCNNANAAVERSTWEKYRFDEDVTGLEDMVLGRQVVEGGGRVGYVASAAVTHIHEETLAQTQKRYYREALVLRDIMPEVHVTRFDAVRYFSAGVFFDLLAAKRQKQFLRRFREIFGFRFMQYLGTYRGHNEHRRLSRAQKEAYFYPQLPKQHGPRTEPAMLREREVVQRRAA
ncbi:MAG: glycosyltransferase family 2 protein [Hyphomonadaceae bacterium]|nr:glycosyltransferase family 2 protein [Hyphomonadaceae bacterium]